MKTKKKEQASIAELSTSAQKVLLYILLNENDRCCELIQARIVAYLGCGGDAARNGIKGLIDGGYIERLENTKNVYRVLFPAAKVTPLDAMRENYDRFITDTYLGRSQ